MIKLYFGNKRINNEKKMEEASVMTLITRETDESSLELDLAWFDILATEKRKENFNIV